LILFCHYVQYKDLVATTQSPGESELVCGRQRKIFFQGNKISGELEKFYLAAAGKSKLYSDIRYMRSGNQDGSGPSFGAADHRPVYYRCIGLVSTISNLANGRSAERAKDVGVRKVIGAAKKPMCIKTIPPGILPVNIMPWVLAVALMFVPLQPLFNSLVA